MIKCSHHYTEGALSNLLDELIPVSDVLIYHNYIFLLFVIKSMIVNIRAVF